MARPKLSDTATSADWSFLELNGVEAALERMSRKVASDWSMPSDAAGDLLAEAHLALAVRGERVRQQYATGGPGRVALLARSYMRDRAKTEKRRIEQQDELDDMLDWNEED